MRGDSSLSDAGASGAWVTVNEPIAEFPETAVHEEHILHDGTLVLRYRDGLSARIVRYRPESAFEPLEGASAFGSDLFVYDGTLHMTYLQSLGGGINRLGIARLESNVFVVVESNVVELPAGDIPRAFTSATDAWIVFRSATRGAFTDAVQFVRYDGTTFEVRAAMPPPDSAFNTSMRVLQDGADAWILFGSTGLPSGDYRDPYRVYGFEDGELRERVTIQTSTSFIRGEPVAAAGSFYLTERQPDGSDAIVRYGLDGSKDIVASSSNTHVFGPVRATNLGPTWVKYYVGSVDNRYSRNQRFDTEREAVVDLPFRWPNGVSEPGGTPAEDFLFGAYDLGTEIIVPFELDGSLHLIANVVSGAGTAGNPYALRVLRYE